MEPLICHYMPLEIQQIIINKYSDILFEKIDELFGNTIKKYHKCMNPDIKLTIKSI